MLFRSPLYTTINCIVLYSVFSTVRSVVVYRGGSRLNVDLEQTRSLDRLLLTHSNSYFFSFYLIISYFILFFLILSLAGRSSQQQCVPVSASLDCCTCCIIKPHSFKTRSAGYTCISSLMYTLISYVCILCTLWILCVCTFDFQRSVAILYEHAISPNVNQCVYMSTSGSVYLYSFLNIAMLFI